MNAQFPIALHILGFLASQKGAPLTSDVLAKTYGTSPVVLRRVLAKLQRAGLVKTQRGAGGGSILARPAIEITLRAAFDAIETNPEVLSRHPTQCSGVIAPVLASYVNDLLGEAERAMLKQLENTTVAQMDKVVRRAIVKANRQHVG